MPVSPYATTSPLIGITGQERFGHEVDRMPPFVGREPIEMFLSPYINSVVASGGTPVLLSRRSNPESVIEKLDGLLLAGGEDVDPRRYGSTPTLNSTPFDVGRDGFEIGLVGAAIARGVPILGVCRGAQLLNVARGGTLIAHLSPSEGESHSYAGYPGTHRSQQLQIASDTQLFDIFGPEVAVNSYHHQAVDSLGDGLRVAAVARDGITEAIELVGHDVLGVQWHPEMFGGDPVFSWLVRKASQFATAFPRAEAPIHA
ncbi:gamma-glutamyl-gamma-aminobutyrate hydrolase family protein [Gordonia McavH-238-E]|uniref:gamma-glutamyl-gamma-aminobutyrate hydrolase family protein n=1 Tax=Gordonia sp. McavH-238-E TaxID=2917736 RepID=UPI001EF5ECD0|nr:gamma-glutamyl-gamma-aminobutyrate hydrolase family protein [Gordonia sp. McavH-238-E]MCG7632921.1 gamma-glutamyl-gamma-aminobutyrate hydrolase family protein [Gordonia sp. McavH-238-E]